MARRTATCLIAACALAFTASSTDAQYIDVPTFVAGTPTFAANMQEVDVAVGTDGNVVFTWEEFASSLGAGNRIVTHLFSRDGLSLAPPARIDVSGYGLYPALISDDQGGYIASWEWIKGGGHALYTRRLDALGRGIGSEVRVDRLNWGPVIDHAIANLATGPVYFWKQNGHWVRRYDPVGNALEDAVEIADNSPGFHGAADTLTDGGFVVAWSTTWLSSDSWARTFQADGTPRGPAFPIDDAGQVDHVAVSPTGVIAAVGGSGADAGDVWLQRFTADGAFVAPREVVRSLPNSVYAKADAAYDSHGNLFVAWTEYDHVNHVLRPARARAYGANGQPLGPDFQLSEDIAIELRTARLADDCFVTGWDGGQYIYGNVVCLCGSAGANGCGDGAVDGQCEQCDDGNTVDGDGCDSNCTPSECGNGVAGGNEACDDHNLTSGDGCDSNCTPTACGNGVITSGEQCDDGNVADGDGCESNCTVTGCGNGVITAGEECDDHNHVDGDGCDSNCTRTGCGNEVVTSGEQCEDGNTVDGDGCDTNCTTTACGNGLITAGEECDDDNRANGDGCDRDCLLEACGNARQEANEQCDDGNVVDGDGCQSDCTLPSTHDSVLFAVRPIEIEIPDGPETATRNVIVQVQNADVVPVRESPGHVIRLTASDGDCPAGTLSRMPDFDPGTPGIQDTVTLDGGVPGTATADVTVSLETFSPFDRRTPQRCTLWFSANEASGESYDPTPDNNVAAVELNVFDSGYPPHSGEEEFFIESINPTTVKIANGQTVVQQQLRPRVRRAGRSDNEDDGVDVTVSAGDGDCPPGTVGVADFDRRSVGAQNGLRLRRGRRSRGSLALIVRSDAFESQSDESPRRCTALLTATAVGDTDASNNTTRLVIDVIDRNDY